MSRSHKYFLFVALALTSVPFTLPSVAQSTVGNFSRIFINGGEVTGPAVSAVRNYLPGTSGTLINAGNLCAVGNFCQTSLTLTNDQIKALPTTGITIIAIPGATKWISVIKVDYHSNFTAGAYTNINTTYADIRVETTASVYLGGYIANDNSVSLTDFSTMFGAANNIAIDTPQYMEPLGTYVRVPTASRPYTSLANLATQVKMDNNGSGNLTGGNAANTLKVTVTYMVQTL